MLLFPAEMLRFSGFAPHDILFFPSQSGIFLVILGVSYLWAIRERSYVKIVILSKAAAVCFLLVHILTSALPPLVVAAAFGDAGMLIIVFWAWRKSVGHGSTAEARQSNLRRSTSSSAQ